MRLLGLDIATRSGATVCDTLANREADAFKARTIAARAPRPPGLERSEICWPQEAIILGNFRDELRAILISEGITAVAIEQPLPPNVTRTVTDVDTTKQWSGQALRKTVKGGVTMGTIFRIYGLVAAAIEICARLNIPYEMVTQDEWRMAFLGRSKAPKGTTDGGAWLKRRAMEQCALLGIEVKNNDQGDSVGVAWYARARFNPHTGFRPDDLLARL